MVIQNNNDSHQRLQLQFLLPTTTENARKLSQKIIDPFSNCHDFGRGMCERLTNQRLDILMPYYQVLWQMFSLKVFSELDFHQGTKEFNDNFVNSLFA
ncbi:MAG: hypothetical protein IGS39_25035 [Calothrix sp. C42_A2020_038]|nr:hypothetical protein [Calothrix sp. C42_A2020_038]